MRGFTLIELIVALVLLGLLSAVAIPNLQNLIGGVDRTTERDRIIDQINGLGRRAVLERSAWVVMSSTQTSSGESSAFPDEETSEGFSANSDDIHLGEIPGDRFVRYPLEVPEQWEIRLDPPLLIRANGVCLGSEMTLLHQAEQVLQLTLHPPYCELKQEDDPENSDSGSG
ncbi:prepilin-type N-terminal cleavage/methylation domain-containing protein [Thioalkalivibrio sp. HK1]|uniref:prepilin-type N-terminal cleavage/methylation domain-containing protein n=1 Tax=Thioalkalivibrio sp. HK1 TaxID=1469245 RepID=UPI000472CE71|nr:prepilin-type N-terminal cleavage/methylation domain-containing protein [Thioalkalivibrio sp. HK1]